MLTLLGGVAAGAVLGVLFAPDKGKQTRKNLSERAKKFSKQARGKFRVSSEGTLTREKQPEAVNL